VTAQPYVPLPATTPLPPQIIAGVPAGDDDSRPAPPDVSGGPLHYGHYGPDGQGWPPPSDQPQAPTELPPGYRPMVRPELPTAYPPVQHFTGYDTQPNGYGTVPRGEGSGDGHQEPTRTYPAGTYGSAAVPPEQRYDARTPLFDQQPPPDFEWGPSPFPAQRPPSEALTPTTDDPLTGPLPAEQDEYDPFAFRRRELPAADSWSDSAFPEEPAALPEEPAPSSEGLFSESPLSEEPAMSGSTGSDPGAGRTDGVGTELKPYAADPEGSSGSQALYHGEVLPRAEEPAPLDAAESGAASAKDDGPLAGNYGAQLGSPGGPARDALGAPVYGAQMGSPGGPARDALGAPMYGAAGEVSGGGHWQDGSALPASGGLPQRVPTLPDVPDVPDVSAVLPPSGESQPAVAGDLARIATFLRHDEVGEPHPDERPDGFDVGAVVAAVSGVEGVRDAKLVAKADGGHTLRLELTDAADPGWVSRVVARLLNDQMGIAAEPDPATPPAPPVPEKRRPPARETTGAPNGAAASNGSPATGIPGAPGTWAGAGASRAFGARAGAPDTAEPDVAVEPDDATSDGYAVGGHSGTRGNGRVLHSVPAGAEVAESVEPDASGGHGARDLRHRRPAGGGRRPGEAGFPISGPPVLGSVTTGGSTPDGAAGIVEGDVATTPIERPGKALVRPGSISSPRVVIDQVEVGVQGLDAVVEVRLLADGAPAVGVANGPNVDGYILRLAASAAAAAIDELFLDEGVPRARCYVEQAAVVGLGNCDVAVVVVLLTCDGWVDQLTGSAKVDGDPRQAVVRATLDAVNRRLEALLP
jgi:hypothetical protein